ncbi:MAG: ROK family protein [Longimicrobiales bacterium]
MPERRQEPWAVGVDIGGTNLVVGVVPLAGGRPLAVASRPTNGERGGDAAVEEIGAMADAVVAEALAGHGGTPERVIGVGVGCPGPLDLATGRIIDTPNLGWADYPIRDRIAERLGLAATLDNDANCAAYGEWWQGAGRGARHVVGVTIGTGIGGGFIVDGRLVRGASGVAGELGHIVIDVDGRRCACGNQGCLEAYASGTSIAARAREGIEAGQESEVARLVDGDLTRITALTVYDALLLGDRYARTVMLETAAFLGAGLASVVNLFNPEVIVVVGGVTRAGDHLFLPLREEVSRRAFPAAVAACRIVPGELGASAGVVGAVGVFAAETAG